MAVAIADRPSVPISMTWGELQRTYASLEELGKDLQFVEGSDHVDPADPEPLFTDAQGNRYRILVMSLEVVLCALVPPNYDPTQLRLCEGRSPDADFVVELLGNERHRALATSDADDDATDPRAVSVTPEDWPADVVLADTPATVSWSRFNQAWLTSVDPAPPIPLSQLLTHLVSWRPSKRSSKNRS